MDLKGAYPGKVPLEVYNILDFEKTKIPKLSLANNEQRNK
jgi:hypothetical protein